MTMDFELLLFDFDGTLFDLEINEKRRGTKKRKEAKAIKNKTFEPETLDVLETLLRDYRIDIITRNHTDTVTTFLYRHWIHNVSVWGDGYGFELKPHPQPAYFAMAQAGVTADETLVIGDSIHDLNLAKAIGSKCAIVANHKLEYQPEGADYYLGNLSDIYEIL